VTTIQRKSKLRELGHRARTALGLGWDAN
jgi:hypothetical protein